MNSEPLILIAISISSILWFGQVTYCQDTYKENELEILPQFRERVRNAITQDYMLENKYLIRFLRARELNQGEAERLLLETMKWRKKFNIDNILQRDFSFYEKRFPMFYGSDKVGRPAASSAIGLLNARKLLLQGKRDELRDYFHYLFERGIQRLHQVSNETGKEFVEAYLVADMAGFDIRNHGCLPCIPGWIELATGYENHYPQLGYQIIIVNTPKVFESVFQILRPLITKHTRDAILLFGYDKSEWSKVLYKLFDKNQLLPEFGGTAKHVYPPPKHQNYKESNFK